MRVSDKDESMLVEVTLEDVVEGVLTIPENIKILDSNFAKSLGNIPVILKLPSTLQQIRTQAFKGMNVKQITIPKTVWHIDPYAFSNMETLEEIKNTSLTVSVQDSWIRNCPNLRKITEGLAIYYTVSYKGYIYYFDKYENKEGIRRGTLKRFSDANDNKLIYLIADNEVTCLSPEKKVSENAYKRYKNFNQYIEKYIGMHLDDKMPYEDYQVLSVQGTDKTKKKIEASGKNIKDATIRDYLQNEENKDGIINFAEFLLEVYSRRETKWQDDLKKITNKGE